MARHIEPGSELSQEDYDYLAARGRVDEMVNAYGCTIPDSVGPRDEEGNPPAPVEFADLQERLPAPATPPGQMEQAAPDQFNADGTVRGDDDFDDDETDEIPPYEEWKKAELLAEIERRNAERDDDDQISPEDEKNATLAAALNADDDAHPDEDNEDDVTVTE